MFQDLSFLDVVCAGVLTHVHFALKVVSEEIIIVGDAQGHDSATVVGTRFSGLLVGFGRDGFGGGFWGGGVLFVLAFVLVSIRHLG
jgi:hypothetical protein